jgi:diguanylate cyclase (GGDEF)-like protein
MRGVRRFPVWTWPLLAAPGLIVAYYVLLRHLGYEAVSTQAVYSSASVAAIVSLVLGAWRHRRAGRGPWLLLAGGQAAMLTGDIVYFLVGRAHGGQVPYPGPPDVAYLSGYLGLAGGLLWLVRRRTPGWDLASIIDAAVAVAAALLGWVYLIEPLASAAGSHAAAQAVTVAYPVMDLGLLLLGVRLMLGAGARPPAFWLLAAWLGATIVGDTVYSVQSLLGVYDGTFVDGVYLFGTLCLAAAGAHRSMARLDASSAVAAPDAGRARLAVLAAAAIVAPCVLAVQDWRGAPLHVPEVAGACIALFLLVVARMAGLVGTQRVMAITDGLTGLRTRRYLEAAFGNEAARSARTGAPTGFLLIDVDHFKKINDTYGHQAGDRVLVELARRLGQLVRRGEVVARYGGEEFAVLLPGTDAAALRATAHRIHRGIVAAPFAIGEGRLVEVTVSIGGAGMPYHAHGVEELSRAADLALYAAKDAGRDQVVMATGGRRPPARRADRDDRGGRVARSFSRTG